jgi:hypothetical protein
VTVYLDEGARVCRINEEDGVWKICVAVNDPYTLTFLSKTKPPFAVGAKTKIYFDVKDEPNE